LGRNFNRDGIAEPILECLFLLAALYPYQPSYLEILTCMYVRNFLIAPNPDKWWLKIPLIRLAVGIAIDFIPERRDLGSPINSTSLSTFPVLSFCKSLLFWKFLIYDTLRRCFYYPK